MQCSRALVRAEIWNPAKHDAGEAFPSSGAMMAAHRCGLVDGEALDENNEVQVSPTLY